MIKRLLQVLCFAFFASNSAASNQPFDKLVNVQVSNSSAHYGEFEIEWVSGFSNEKILEKVLSYQVASIYLKLQKGQETLG